MTMFDPITLRRELHEIPELGMNTVKTADYVMDKLKALGVEAVRGVGKADNGIVATIKGQEQGPVVMIRADMDALPFKIDGKDVCIHACGHDSHTAMLLAAVEEFKKVVKKGTLKVVFQPGEETLEGAIGMSKGDLLDDVDYAFGAHIRPIQDIEPGSVCAGINHSASTKTKVVVHGKNAHAARPHLGINAIDVSVSIIAAVNSMWFDPAKTWSVKATQIHSDSGATNSIPPLANITFDMRANTNPLMTELREKFALAVTNTAQAYGAEAEIIWCDTCPAADYDPELQAMVAEIIKEEVGEDKLAPNCGGGGEDFHCFKEAKPSLKTAYFGLGVGANPGLHNANMSFDEQYLPLGTKLHVAIVKRMLG